MISLTTFTEFLIGDDYGCLGFLGHLEENASKKHSLDKLYLEYWLPRIVLLREYLNKGKNQQ